MLPVSRAFLRLQMRTRRLHDAKYRLFSNGTLLHIRDSQTRAMIRLVGHTGILVVVTGQQPRNLLEQLRTAIAEVDRDCSQNLRRFAVCPRCVQHGGGGESDAPALFLSGCCVSCGAASPSVEVDSCTNCRAASCALYPLIADDGGTCTRCNAAFSAQELRDGAEAVPHLQRRSLVWDFVCGDAFRTASGWSDRRLAPPVINETTGDHLLGSPYRLTTLHANETETTRRREFSRIREQFYRFMGVESEQRFELTEVEVIDNPAVERRFSDYCAVMRERMMRSGDAVRRDQVAEDAAEVACITPGDEQTQVLRDELRRHVRSLPWEERCILLMQDGGDVFNDIVLSYDPSDEQRVSDQLPLVVLEERHRWREWILDNFERCVGCVSVSCCAHGNFISYCALLSRQFSDALLRW